MNVDNSTFAPQNVSGCNFSVWGVECRTRVVYVTQFFMARPFDFVESKAQSVTNRSILN
jgi:hypothetical protein